MNVTDTYSYSLVIRDVFHDALKSAPYFQGFTVRKSRALQVWPNQLPFLGVYIVGEDMVPDGDDNAGYISFIHSLRIGFSVMVVNNDPVACEAQLDQAFWAIMNRLWRDEYIMNMIDTRAYPGGIGNPDNTRIEGVSGGTRRHVYGNSQLDNETPIGELQYEARCKYRTEFGAIITDDFLEAQFRTGVKIGETEEEMAVRQQIRARYTLQQFAGLEAGPAVVAGVGVASLPAPTLPRVPWEGGSDYWSQFPKAAAAGWNSSTFFPIAVFLVKPEGAIGHPAALAAIGVNTAMAVEHQPPIGSLTDHLFAIVHTTLSAGDWLVSDAASDPKVVGWFVYDECEMGMGACAAGTDEDRLALHQSWCDAYRALNDGRFLFANFGNGVLNTFWAPGTMPQWMAQVDACSCDKYAYTSTDVRISIKQSLDWPGTEAQAQSGAAYGWMQDQMHGFDASNSSRRPVWCFVETKMPYLADTGRGIILYAQIEGAVWSAITHEARGIAYFQHNGFYDAQNGGPPAIDPNTGVAPDQHSYSLIECEVGLRNAVSAINAKVASLAPVLNTQSFVWNFAATGINTMLKWSDGYSYVFAVLAIGASTGSKTFTLPPHALGATVEVVGESRSIPVVSGQFTDTFANEYTHHVYKIADG